jgi:hypothetical protein
MKKAICILIIGVALVFPVVLFAMPSVYPTATTIYKPGKCFNWFTILAGEDGRVIDMNGNLVKTWPGVNGFPSKIYPGGYIGTQTTGWPDGGQDQIAQQIRDFDNNVVWSFDRYEKGKKSGLWASRQHHDFNIKGFPVYFVPGSTVPNFKKGTMLVLGHINVVNPKIHKLQLIDDVMYEVDMASGRVVWEWKSADHYDELGFDEAATRALQGFSEEVVQEAIDRAPQSGFDWWHQNCANYLGPNRWYDNGDGRFHPENIIFDSRHANIVVIIDRKTGKVVWRCGPDYSQGEDARLEWIVGPHHTHMIPKGLPGEGNIMIYDNGGWGGYGSPTAMAPKGDYNVWRDYSRVIEFNPTTKKIVWEYSPKGLKMSGLTDNACFINGHMEYSPLVSSAQRLSNGNTLITQGVGGRLIEVTPELEVVWEYIHPYLYNSELPALFNLIYRAYRVPYDWVPQLKKPKEIAVFPPSKSDFQIPAVDGSTPDVGKDQKGLWNPAWGKRN